MDQHRHNGFFLRLTLGPSYGFVDGDQHVFRDVGDISLSGLGFAASIAIGGALVDNLILNADLFQMTIFDPELEIDGRDLDDFDDPGDELGIGEDVELVGIGVGLTYYIMPVNVYVGGAVGIGQIVFENDHGDREGSDIGFAGNLIVGKEWWVGDDWGLGVAGQFMLVAAEDDVLDDTLGYSFNLLFSASYN